MSVGLLGLIGKLVNLVIYLIFKKLNFRALGMVSTFTTPGISWSQFAIL